ncbi:MAG: hypothetical protein GDA41_12260 [Rhodospirillales bacterium]|nr:hypothetical protein [Rhodospirillales bacterium]
MADAKFRVKLFDVVPFHERPIISFDDIVRRVCQYPIAQRVQPAGSRKCRLGEIHDNANYLLMNFEALDFSGPKRSKETKDAVPFDLADDEYFAYDTAALYHLESSVLLVEGGRHAFTATALESYLAHFVTKVESAYHFEPKLDREAKARFQKMQSLRKVEFAASMPPIDKAELEADVPINKAIDHITGQSGVILSITISAHRNEKLFNIGLIREWFSCLVDKKDENKLTKAKAHGRLHEGAETQIIDLL